MPLTLREAIDRTAGAQHTRVLIGPDDREIIEDFADTVASHAGISRGSEAHRQIAAALSLMYRAGVVAGGGGPEGAQ